ncbi:MAG: hypothetical protein V1849_04690 [Chloroflexota bacterium]
MKNLLRKLPSSSRFVLAFALAGCGAGLLFEHLLYYGGTLHFTFPDHGVVGAILLVIGTILAGLKPGRKRR